jgi:hypothetical protein
MLSLCPLQVAEARAIGEGGEHAGRDDVWDSAMVLILFCQSFASLLI